MKFLYKIPAANLPLLQERIGALAKRAAKVAAKGDVTNYIPIGLAVGEKILEERKNLPPAVFYQVTITGMSPRLDGWTFVATLQHEEDGTIVRPLPTVDLPEGALAAYRFAPPSCDHCGYKRRRNDTYVVRHDDGTMKQCGRNCLTDFTGVKHPQALAAIAEYLAMAASIAQDSEHEVGGGGGHGPQVEDLGTYLAFVARVIRKVGWLSRGKARENYNGPPASADLAWSWMHPNPNLPPKDREIPNESEKTLATEALAWAEEHFASVDPLSLSDYEHNLRVVISGGVATLRVAGIAASLIPYYERARGQELMKTKAINAGYVGTVGKTETFTLTLAQVFSYDSQYGVQHTHKFLTDDGAVVVWRTGTVKLDPGKYQVKGTVKDHSEYKGTPQTVLTRCYATKVAA